MCTSSEMRVTTNSIITTSPSTRVPTVNLIAPFCHHVKLSITGFTIASAVAAGLGAEDAASEAPEAFAVTGGVVDALDPLHDRDDRRART